MATYPYDPHLPLGTKIIPLNLHHRRRGYHIFSGAPLLNYDDWAIVVLEPPTDPVQFLADAALIRHFLNDRGFHVRQITRSGMGAALIQFSDGVSRDSAIDRSPLFVGDSILRVIP
jgi:hypothetical protein